ncbi:MAG: hypothetical protein AAF702_04760 [Chloroflexota bacterium]
MGVDGTTKSQLFTIRLWIELDKTAAALTRIRVHHVLSGYVRYFRDWVLATEFIMHHTAEAGNPLCANQLADSVEECHVANSSDEQTQNS